MALPPGSTGDHPANLSHDLSWDLNQHPSSYKTSSIPLSHELQSFVIILEKMEKQKWKKMDLMVSSSNILNSKAKECQDGSNSLPRRLSPNSLSLGLSATLEELWAPQTVCKHNCCS